MELRGLWAVLLVQMATCSLQRGAGESAKKAPAERQGGGARDSAGGLCASGRFASGGWGGRHGKQHGTGKAGS